MNLAESKKIKDLLEQFSFNAVSSFKSANLVIINTCSVRQAPENKLIEITRKLKALKKTTKLKLAVTGCVANLVLGSNLKRPDINLAKKLAGVDFFFKSSDLLSLEKFLKTICDPIIIKNTPLTHQEFSAYIPISTGCDNFCSYCIVPYARGPEKSRSEKEIIQEIKQKLQEGVIEIVLLGQNVNSYQLESNKRQLKKFQPKTKIPFIQLLKKINSLAELQRIYFLTSHPKDMSKELIDTVAELPKLCKYFHLPIQSGSNRILKLMNRKYTVKKYLKLIELIRKKIPFASITTDIIVGFPNETEQDFQKTVEVMKKVEYDMAFISRYSPRPYTASAKLADNIPQKTKKERHKILTNILRETALKRNQKLLNQKLTALIVQKNNKTYIGKLHNLKEIHFNSSKKLASGTTVNVIVTKALSWGLKGKLVF